MPHINDITNTSRPSTTSLNNNADVDSIVEEYDALMQCDEFIEIDDRLIAISQRWRDLPYPQRVAIALYAEYGSLRKVASLLGISHSTLNKYLKSIRLTLLCEPL